MATVVAALALVAATAGAATVERDTAYGDGADSHVRNDDSTSSRKANFGASTTFLVQDNGNNRWRAAYLRFDVSDLGGPIGDLEEADLTITWAGGEYRNNTPTFRLWGLADGTDADRVPTGSVGTGGWIETGPDDGAAINYMNKPAGSGKGFTTDSGSQTGTPQAYAVNLGTFTWNEDGLGNGDSITVGHNPSSEVLSMSAGFADDLLAFLQADTNDVVTLMLSAHDDVGKSMSFYTKENTGTDGSGYDASLNPKLTLAMPDPAAVIPEPLTMLAVVGGLGAVGGYVRRRRS
jgi:hypothetical protein